MENIEVAQTEQTVTDQVINDESSDKTKTVVTKSAEELAVRLKEVSEEAKGYRQKLAAQKKESEEMKRKSLEEQGQYKELADIFKSKAEAAEAKFSGVVGAFSGKIVADALALEAAKLGCIDTDALLHLMDVKAIPINDNFDVDRTHVKTVLEEFKKGKPYLFQKQTPRIPDGTPGKVTENMGKPIEKMSSQELEAALMKRFGKK